jgi:transketolase
MPYPITDPTRTRDPSRRTLANAIRALSMDAVQKANSGHPGAPMGMADIAEVLWNDFLRHNPADPNWLNRDRFIMSNGHGSMLLYALLHLSGYALSIDEIKNFRQLHSKTPGHPEHGVTPGVETTTGPLGQGLANAVGMALAEALLAAEFNREGLDIVDHYTYVTVGDGCLMEGISHEACSFAGTLGLGKLIALYDDNGISIDGEVDGWFADETVKRFEAYGWQVIPPIDGHDSAAIAQALAAARAERNRPSLVCCKTVIGWGAPTKQGTEACHGSALGEAEVAKAREFLDWPHAPFEIPEAIYAAWDGRAQGARRQAEWDEIFSIYSKSYPDFARELLRRVKGDLPAQWPTVSAAYIAATQDKGENIASRKASQNALNSFGPILPELLGGSADLAESNMTRWSGVRVIHPGRIEGNYINYGVREFAMSAVMNGIALHGGFIPYGGTFLVFSDYARNAIRLAALIGVRSIFVLTHDSIGVGEDGPTHQPVEHAASLRLMPNLSVWRPGDTVESAVAWQAAIERRTGPSALLFSRQNLPHQPRTPEQVAAIARGGYVLADCEGEPEAILIATGSELGLAVEAAATLSGKGRKVRVVSMPCCDRFDAQDLSYREGVLPSAVWARVAVEAGVRDYWWKYVGLRGAVIGVDRYGESAPGGAVYKYLGITAERVVEAVYGLL